MIKSYLGLLIFFAVQHQVSSLSADVDHRKHTQKIRKDRKYMMKELQNIHRRSDIRQDSIDNYDLIVFTEPSETSIKPALRHLHRHHRLRSGRDATVPIKNDNTHKPLEDANTLRKNFELTGKTNMTQIQGYKNASTKKDLNEYQRGGKDIATTHIQKEKDAATENGLNEHRSERENEATTLMQKDIDAITKKYLNENWREGEKVATMEIEKEKNAVAKNYLSEHRKGIENEATTLIQKDKNATIRTYLNENRKGEEKVATTHIQKYKDATTTNYLNEHRRERQNETTTQTQEDKDATTTNYLNEHRRERQNETTTQTQEDKDAKTTNYLNEHRTERQNETTTQTQEDKDATTTNYLNEHRSERENETTTQINKNKDASTTNYLIKNWREEEKNATTSQKQKKKKKKRPKVTRKVTFYRRVNYLSDQERNKPQKWVHCLDLVGPRLKGYQDNWHPVEKNNRNTGIKRLGELINTDVSQYTEGEIISLLSQINNIDIRLFQWDYTAITTIINIIIRGTTIHSFRTLKAGVKYMFSRWHLDTSMQKTFLEQTRIFRPPCIDISGRGGITKKPGGVVLFTKPHKSTKKPRGGDESCHSSETTTVNNND